jgi:NitT/TauT family transport system substrate-binding protein
MEVQIMAEPTRRQIMLAGAAFAAAFALGPRGAHAADLRKLKFGVGLKAMGPAVISTLIGEGLGYNAAEGFTLAPAPLGTNANVQIAIDRGDVDIGIGVPSFGLPLLAKGEWQGALNYYEYTYPYKWDVAVPPDSKAKTYADLKGLRIGVSDFGSTEYPVTRNILKNMGIDPDTNAKWIAVGNGVQSGVALQRGAIDALAYYDTGFGQIEGANIPFRILPRPANLPMIGGQFLTATKKFLVEQRPLAVGLGRSVAKASTFLLANPEAGAKVFLKMYPETAPRGSSTEEAVKAVLQASARRIQLFKPPYPDAKMGRIHPAEFIDEAKMFDYKIGELSGFYTNDLIPEINQFDAGKIAEAARGYVG